MKKPKEKLATDRDMQELHKALDAVYYTLLEILEKKWHEIEYAEYREVEIL